MAGKITHACFSCVPIEEGEAAAYGSYGRLEPYDEACFAALRKLSFGLVPVFLIVTTIDVIFAGTAADVGDASLFLSVIVTVSILVQCFKTVRASQQREKLTLRDLRELSAPAQGCTDGLPVCGGPLPLSGGSGSGRLAACAPRFRRTFAAAVGDRRLLAHTASLQALCSLCLHGAGKCSGRGESRTGPAGSHSIYEAPCPLCTCRCCSTCSS